MSGDKVVRTYADAVVSLGRRAITRFHISQYLSSLARRLDGINQRVFYRNYLEVWDTRGLAVGERDKALELIAIVRDETKMILGDSEAFLIYATVQSTSKIEGDIAEVCVYRHGSSNLGGTAKLMCEAKGEKKLHMFDVFEGVSLEHGDERFIACKFAGSLDAVADYLKDYKNVFFYRGILPGVAKPVKNSRFSFVHLHLNTFVGTIECLNLFYPLMSTGGVIVSHDILGLGVRKAFDEFFVDKPEPVIESFATQALVVKTRAD